MPGGRERGGVEEMRGILSLHTLAMHLLVVSPLTCLGTTRKTQQLAIQQFIMLVVTKRVDGPNPTYGVPYTTYVVNSRSAQVVARFYVKEAP